MQNGLAERLLPETNTKQLCAMCCGPHAYTTCSPTPLSCFTIGYPVCMNRGKSELLKAAWAVCCPAKPPIHPSFHLHTRHHTVHSWPHWPRQSAQSHIPPLILTRLAQTHTLSCKTAATDPYHPPPHAINNYTVLHTSSVALRYTVTSHHTFFGGPTDAREV